VSGVPKCDVKTPSGAWRVRRESRIRGLPHAFPRGREREGRAGAIAVDLLIESCPVVGLEDPSDLVDVERGEGQPGAAGFVDPLFRNAEPGPRTEVPPPKSQNLSPALLELGRVDLGPASIRRIEGDLDADDRRDAGERSRPQVRATAAALPGPIRNPAFVRRTSELELSARSSTKAIMACRG